MGLTKRQIEANKKKPCYRCIGGIYVDIEQFGNKIDRIQWTGNNKPKMKIFKTEQHF